MELSDLIQIIIGILSLIATIAVSVVIYWLQRQHEKELQKLAQMQQQNDLEEKAACFLMEHESEKDYLPWCVLAANLHRLERHTRGIYMDYCHCNEALRDEILKQAGLEICSIKGHSWVNICIERLKSDIKRYNLGQDYLYEGAKYFHRSFLRYRDALWHETPPIFSAINTNSFRSKMFHTNRISIGDYIDEYFFWYIDKKMEFGKDVPIPPMDYVWIAQDLGNSTEENVCMWIMEAIENIAIIVGNRKPEKQIGRCLLEYTDARPETFEDKYYEVLQALYNTYFANFEMPNDGGN